MTMTVESMVEAINGNFGTIADLANELGVKQTQIRKQFKEAGYQYSRKEKRYIKVENEGNSGNIETNDKSKGGKQLDSKNQTNNEINNENNDEIKINDESKDEISEQTKQENEIDDILNSFSGKKKEEYKPVTTHLRNDINKALIKFGKENGRGSKQELINKLLEMALKRSGHL